MTSVAQRTKIEQSIARGESPEHIATSLNVPLRNVHAVRAALDRINNESDKPTAVPNCGKKRLQPCGTRAAYERHRRRKEPVDDACKAAKTEYAAVYGRR